MWGFKLGMFVARLLSGFGLERAGCRTAILALECLRLDIGWQTYRLEVDWLNKPVSGPQRIEEMELRGNCRAEHRRRDRGSRFRLLGPS